MAASESRTTRVLTDEAAAAYSFWPQLSRWRSRPCAVTHERSGSVGITNSPATAFPPELIVDSNRADGSRRQRSPHSTCAHLGGDAIDQALRTRATTLELMHTALAHDRRPSRQSRPRELLLDSRDEPWSAAERRMHRLLRSAGITGWKANQPITIDGSTYYLDVLFRGIRLLIEIDGREHHIGKEVFETDRWRQNLLVLDGWCVLRFTWAMLEERPDEVVAMVRAALTMLARRHTGAASGSSIAAANWEL